jgi:hypothetical protein
LRPDRLLVGLSPEAVGFLRISPGRRPRRRHEWSLDCDPGYGPQSWDGVVQTLRGAVAALQKDYLSVTVVLSNRFVRYALVPFDAAAAGPEEEVALARFHFARIHGERAKGWEIRMSRPAERQPRLASGIDGGLLNALRECFPRRAKARLVSIQPHLMAAYNCARGTLPREGAWLALSEKNRACLALATAEGWRSVQFLRVLNGEPESLADLLTRACMRAEGLSPRSVVVWGADAAEIPGWKVAPLLQSRASAHPACAMAACAQ